MSVHKITAVRCGFTNGMDWEAEHEIAYTYLPGARPIINPADDADPGFGAEIGFVSVEPDAGDHGAFSDLAQEDLVEWAREWLDDHYHECVEQAEADRQPDPDDQRDQEIEYREMRERDR